MSLLNKYKEGHQYNLFKYIFIGFITVFIYLILLYLLDEILHLSNFISVTVSYTIVSLFNFSMHSEFTFRNRNKSIKKKLRRYVFLLITSYMITIFIITVLTNYDLELMTSTIVAIFLSFIYSYIVSKYHVF